MAFNGYQPILNYWRNLVPISTDFLLLTAIHCTSRLNSLNSDLITIFTCSVSIPFNKLIAAIWCRAVLTTEGILLQSNKMLGCAGCRVADERARVCNWWWANQGKRPLFKRTSCRWCDTNSSSGPTSIRLDLTHVPLPPHSFFPVRYMNPSVVVQPFPRLGTTVSLTTCQFSRPVTWDHSFGTIGSLSVCRYRITLDMLFGL